MRSNPSLIGFPIDELGDELDEVADDLPGACGRALSLPSLCGLAQPRRQAVLNASEATAPPAIVQKLRLLMRA